MPELQLNSDGQLVDEGGKVVEINGEAVTVANAKPQDEVDAAFQREKTKHKTALDKLTAQIKALSGQADRSAETERMLSELRDEKSELEKRLADAEADAEGKVAAKIKAATDKATGLEQALETERTERLHEQVTNAILGEAGNTFNNPALDVVPNLLKTHKREPRLGSDGKPIEGKFDDLFELEFENEKGESVREYLPVKKALEVWASKHTHHVSPSGAAGSGGGSGYVNTGTMKRSEMSAAQKADFVGKHGVEKFQALPG